jgi:5-dehydro-2-deoxygluconokinase
VLGLKDRDTFPLLFYRENCADMASMPPASAKPSSPMPRAADHRHAPQRTPVRAAPPPRSPMRKKHGLLRVLDIDYRPVLWGLSGKAATAKPLRVEPGGDRTCRRCCRVSTW